MQSDAIQSEMDARVSEILFYVWDPIGINGVPSLILPLSSKDFILTQTEAIGRDETLAD
jgi:hypothetical protein